MTVQTRPVEYHDGTTLLEGWYAWDDAIEGKRPGVLVGHMWAGLNAFPRQKAVELATLGYTALAWDMYGKGVVGATPAACDVLMTPFVENRSLTRTRTNRALETLRRQRETDAELIAAIGYCFGGMCALELCRHGADLRGAVSFHGRLSRDVSLPNAPIQAKILAIHGHDDPLVPYAEVDSFRKEMTEAGADWQLHLYGGTMHSFTNPAANDPAGGGRYHPDADRRSWKSMTDFLAEVFGNRSVGRW